MDFNAIKLAVFATAVFGLSTSLTGRALPDQVSPRDLVGTWAVLHGNTKSDACKSDYISDFLPDGRYGGEMEDGVWSLSGNILTIKILRSNYETGGEGPMRRLRRPELRKIRISKRKGGQINFDHDIGVRCQ